MLGSGGKNLIRRSSCCWILVSEGGGVVWSEGQCWTWTTLPPQKDNKDGLWT